MKKIGVYVNRNKDRNLSVTNQVITCAENEGFQCQIFLDTKQHDEVEISKNEELLREKDFIIVLGGDGTILRVASLAAKLHVPLLSVNLGHLGFLTELELCEVAESIRKIKNEEFYLENRMMLSCVVDGVEYLALNDVCLQRASRTRLLKFKAYAGEEFIDSLSADGVLVSSPTGSTAYSLSAGGPIVSPKLSLMLMTPICAHTLRARPIAFSDDEVLKFKTEDKCGFSIVCDGALIHTDKVIESVQISKSEYSLQLIHFKQNNFFERLQTKLAEWNLSKE